ncbi:MAG TPA: DUF1573 domain-containing protein [Chitinophagaceae bacterium]|jgi:hypothetical protein|nr:DUF1573 domain-containing protein [Chitinophagaceae bacterium]
MRKIFFLFVLLAAFGAVQAQTTSTAAAVLSVKATEHDFGKIPQGKPVYTYFEITNNGTEPLKLDAVQASCGCTTPEWSQEPIAPGATTKIKVGYNAAAEGNFEKQITIRYKGSETLVVKIKGTVWKAPEGSAPSNGPVSLLKTIKPQL